MNASVGCIIVDDEHGAIEILEKYVSKVTWLDLQGSFSDPLEALNHLSQSHVDLVFMDINMPDLSGLQLSRLIEHHDTSVIFCTAYAEHAVESYEVTALDYLLKPISFERFLAAVNKVPRHADSRKQNPAGDNGGDHRKIFIKSGSSIHQVDTAEISFMQKDGHYIIFRVAGRELLSRMTITELLELLPPEKFIRVHRSWVVSLERIELIQKQFLTIDGREIPIGDSYKEAFFKRIESIGD